MTGNAPTPAPIPADRARAVIADVLAGIAPDADLDTIDPDGDLQQQADLDSMDFLALIEGIAARVGLDIPEEDYEQLATLSLATAYVASRAPDGATGAGAARRLPTR